MTLPLHVWSIPWKTGRSLHLLPCWSPSGKRVARLAGHWLPTCPVLPRGQQDNWKNRTSAWRAPRARREGAEDGCGAERGGGPRPRSHSGDGEGLRVDPRSRSTTLPRISVSFLNCGRAPPPELDPAAGAGRRVQVRGPGSPRPQCARRRNGAAAPRAPPKSHLRPSTACRHRSWLRAPLALRWPNSSVPESARSAGAGHPWHRRARGWQLELDRHPVHLP